METYARLLQELIDDESDLLNLFDTMSTTSLVKDKAAWLLKWSDRGTYSFATRVVALAIVKGVFFSSSIAAILWIQSRGILPGFCHSTELIMRDLHRHMDFACQLYRTLDDEVSVGVVHSMVRDAVVLERKIFRSTWNSSAILGLADAIAVALPQALCGLNSLLMDDYVGYVADVMLRRLGFPALYDVANPVSLSSNLAPCKLTVRCYSSPSSRTSPS